MPKYPQQRDLAIFKRWPNVDELAELLLYESPQYVMKVRSGYMPLTDRFKRRAVRLLGESEETLFAPVGAAGMEEGNGSDS